MPKEFAGRREDLRLVTGRGRYTADWSLPGTVHGGFLRADRAHALIRGIDTSAAAASPGVLAVLIGADILEAGYLIPPGGPPLKSEDGTPLRNPSRPALATDRVRFVGEPLALVVAETADAAADAIELIAVDYEPLAAVVSAPAAIAPGAAQLHEAAPGNLALAFGYGDKAATEAAFAKAAHVVRVDVTAQRLSASPMEPKSALVAHDAAGEVTDVYVPCQGAADIAAALAQVTGEPIGRFRIHAQDVGGAFGVRNEIYPEYVALMLAARRLGRPVKWVGTRSESMVSDHHGRGAVLTGELALDAEGRFLALRIGWLVDLGAWCSSAGPLINTIAAPRTSAINAYRIPSAYGLNRLVFTNATPETAYRGAGRPNVAYLAERLVDEAARITGIDRIDLRRKNLIRREDFPYPTPTGSTYDSGDPPALLAEALAEADWAGFAARRAEAAGRGKLRGIGCAVFIEPSGGAVQEEIEIRIDGDGRLDLFANAGPSGQGHETAFPALVAGLLGVDADAIRLRWNDPDGPRLKGTGSFGSRSLVSHGAALATGARELIRKGLAHAAEMLEAAQADVEFADGLYRVAGTDRGIRIEEVIRRLAPANGGRHPLDTRLAFDAASAFPSGAHVSEVEIDPETGEVALLSYVAVDDCGTVYNPVLVEGQFVGGLMQGIGQVLGEACRYDPETGQLLSGSFMDYAMPRAHDQPPVRLFNRPVPSPANPLGAKGAGEAGTTGAVPCVANAVLDALAPLGITRLDTPFTPDTVWRAIRKAKGR
ncbi:MAG TPA: xanthine dehydrogenase family protein molybdopterin-binding subunit [Hyphomicrobiales bacterium]|nr:xanthine dehydrogenase family protein molybdopterin-binding subunit [Hyphomicrobiales bacterium]